MVGNIYSEQKCPVCGGGMVHDERRSGVFCVEHPKIAATSRFVVKFGRSVRRRFSNYEGARRLLWKLRGEADEGTLDPRDYASGKPMSIRISLTEWLKKKEQETRHRSKRTLRRGTFKSYKPAVARAVAFFDDRNIKTLTHDDVEGFFYHILDMGLSEKTAKNNVDTLKVFYNWLLKNRTIGHDEMPAWPTFDVEMAMRDIVDLETQQMILDEIRKAEDIKVWFACSLLARHPNVRPGELLQIERGDIDLELGKITIRPEIAKTKTKVVIYLFDDEVEFLAGLPVEFPRLRFFRHSTSRGGVKVGDVMGDKLFNRAWCRAAAKLGIEGVSLYSGTKHSTTSAVGEAEGRAAAKELTGHRTNSAFERYYRESRKGALRVLSARERLLANVVGIHGEAGGTSGTQRGHQKETPKNRT